jgi:hypothetical protein
MLVGIHPYRRRDLTGLVADTAEEAFLSLVNHTAHGIWINRQEADLQAL